MALRTQWRHGINGPTGLDYGLPYSRVLHHLQVPAAARDDLFFDVQVMESAALAAMYEE